MLYAHLDTTGGGGLFGYGQTTPLRWEITNRKRPTSRYSFPVDESIINRLYHGHSLDKSIVCSYLELKPFIKEVTE